jgi:hypothetical protein
MSNLGLCLVLLPLVLGQGVSNAPVDTPAGFDSVVFRYRSDRFLISSIDLEIDPAGRGKLVFVRKGLAKPIERDVEVANPVVRDLDAALARLHFLSSDEKYQTSEDHSNLGEVTIAVAHGDVRRETRFNYTTNRDMAAMQELLRGIANREIYVFDLETAVRFQPLETPTLLGALGDEIGLGHITDPQALLPLLHGIAEDVSLPLIARNRASALADRIAGRKHT